jgi:hypothetical protein
MRPGAARRPAEISVPDLVGDRDHEIEPLLQQFIDEKIEAVRKQF